MEKSTTDHGYMADSINANHKAVSDVVLPRRGEMIKSRRGSRVGFDVAQLLIKKGTTFPLAPGNSDCKNQ